MAAEEDKSWLDPEWTAALEEMSQAVRDDSIATATAIAKDERRILGRIRKLSRSRIHAVSLRHPLSGSAPVMAQQHTSETSAAHLCSLHHLLHACGK